MRSNLRQNLIITCIVTLIGVVLCTLGFNPANEPIDSLAVIWPGTLLHTVGAILFGGWGVLATVLSAIIVNALKTGEPYAVYGYIIPGLIQPLIPAIYYRRVIKLHGWDTHTFRFLPYFFVCVVCSNLAGAVTGAFIFNLGQEGPVSTWLPMARWFIANAPIALILGWPLFRCLGPAMAEEGLTVNGWWR